MMPARCRGRMKDGLPEGRKPVGQTFPGTAFIIPAACPARPPSDSVTGESRPGGGLFRSRGCPRGEGRVRGMEQWRIIRAFQRSF
jgi:hypothetical protein